MLSAIDRINVLLDRALTVDDVGVNTNRHSSFWHGYNIAIANSRCSPENAAIRALSIILNVDSPIGDMDERISSIERTVADRWNVQDE